MSSSNRIHCNGSVFSPFSLFLAPHSTLTSHIPQAALLLTIILLVWKVGCWNNLRNKTTTANDSESNSKKVHQLSLPYPHPPSEIYEATKTLGPNSRKCWPNHDPVYVNFFYTISIATSTLVDPYLVTNNFNNSLISQDDSFKRMVMPEPVLKWRESVNHSAGYYPELMVAQPFKVEPHPSIQLYDDDDKKSIPCAYLIYTFNLKF
jgi:hypothetical protein